MGVFSRLGDIINSNINALLDRAEDPRKMLNNIIQEMEDTLVEVRTSAAKSIAEKKQLQRQLQVVTSKQADWQQKATLALSKTREDLAKAALLEKMRLTEIATALGEHLQFVNQDIGKYQQDIKSLQDKLNEARNRQKKLLSRLNCVKSQQHTRKATDPSRLEKVLSQLNQFEQQIDRAEADVESRDLGKQQHLSDAIRQIEADDAIESELKILKSQLKKSP